MFDAAPVDEATGDPDGSEVLMIFGTVGPLILEETPQDIYDPDTIRPNLCRERARSLTGSRRHEPLS